MRSKLSSCLLGPSLLLDKVDKAYFPCFLVNPGYHLDLVSLELLLPRHKRNLLSSMP